MKKSNYKPQIPDLMEAVFDACLLYTSNLIDSHDTARFLHLCNGNKKKQHLAAAFQLLLPGMPMIYYGDEFAMPGANDPDCRRGMYWDCLLYTSRQPCIWQLSKPLKNGP